MDNQFAKASGSRMKRGTAPNEEMGEFEDAWEDEIESDEEVVDEEQNDDENVPAVEDSEEQSPPDQVFIPGYHTLGEDEILEADDSVYLMRHSMGVDYPSLSFDILRDSLGDERQSFPTTAYFVTGAQGETMKKNELRVCKLSSLHKTQKNGDSDSEDDDDEDDDRLDEDPVLEYRSVPHVGGVNRIRAQPLPPSTPLPPVSQPYHVATWAETGKVHIWDVRPLIESLDVPGYAGNKDRTQSPVFTVNSHGRAEGFAMDWAASGPSSLRLLTGDIHSKIYLTTSAPSGFNALSQPFTSHTSSVEDIQWSPSEPTVFASCSADKTIQVWDVRSKGRKSVASIDEAHDGDVNVISWNKSTTYLLLSGGDEGGIKVWDFRNMKKKRRVPTTNGPVSAPIASFNWHKAPITSIEWHPTEDSMFLASSADDQVTLWDLAVEQDDDEMGAADSSGEQNVPPQLLFSHHQQNVKEAHWHPQIPGSVIGTGADGFDVYKTISV
ncbi:WD40-repeat-containing domain protein [Desarmillaria tabescens]|uniref:Glutamate-rich WD repeat-containing protein 1 n=1 Tax=Armillaria tabescens TaxID=1929756 RepID=A0AA39TXZ9_ARMTA|nr:WD40-repeat-containing domain protein [Desarmillaria tabescens]KAK0466409.1 WD40-repeat-containing domain protein [Desarmillaria tabescens]